MKCHRIISLNSKWKNLFDMLIILLTTYSCMNVIFLLEFDDKIIAMTPFDITVEVLFGLYMFTNFFQAYLDPKTNKVVKNPMQIALHYLTGWFIIDIISSVPYELFYFKYLRLIRVIRLKKIFDFFQFWTHVTLRFRGLIKYVRMACIMLCGTFLSTCVWYLIAKNLNGNADKNFILENKMKDNSAFTNFIICFYFTLTTLTTTGFGDFYPISVNEKIIVVIFMFIGVTFFTYLMSFLYEEISITDDETFKIHNFMTDLSKFNLCKAELNFDKETTEKLTKNILFTAYNARYSKYDTRNILNVLPHQYKIKLAELLWSDLYTQFCRHFFIDYRNQKFFYKLSYLFRYKKFNQGDVVYEPSKAVCEFYMIQKGYVEIDKEEGEYRSRLQKGDVIGDFYLLYDLRPGYRYTAMSDLEVVAIIKEDFVKELGKDEEMYRKVKDICVYKYKETVVNAMNKEKRGDWGHEEEKTEKEMRNSLDLNKNGKENYHMIESIRNEAWVNGIGNIYKESFKLDEKINQLLHNRL